MWSILYDLNSLWLNKSFPNNTSLYLFNAAAAAALCSFFSLILLCLAYTLTREGALHSFTASFLYLFTSDVTGWVCCSWALQLTLLFCLLSGSSSSRDRRVDLTRCFWQLNVFAHDKNTVNLPLMMMTHKCILFITSFLGNQPLVINMMIILSSSLPEAPPASMTAPCCPFSLY